MTVTRHEDHAQPENTCVRVSSGQLHVEVYDDSEYQFYAMDHQVDYEGFIACVLVEILDQLKKTKTSK